MADRSINIGTSSTNQTEFQPNPLNAANADIVSWANRTNASHQIAINAAAAGAPAQWITFTEEIKPFTSSTPAYVCQATSIEYKCIMPNHTESGKITIVGLLMCVLLLGFFAPAVRAQTPVTGAIDCSPIIGKPLQVVPEIAKTGGGQILQGTLVTAGANVRMPFVVGGRQAGSLLNANGTVNTGKIQCIQQWVRAYSKDAPPGSQDPGAPVLNPMPGPTIRGSVGDLIELTFMDLIDPLNFPRADIGKCDQYSTIKNGVTTQVYPTADKYPDCFNESINTNVHFHGTHTNPNSSGDNVFLQLKPTPRAANASRAPVITNTGVNSPYDIKAPFNDFFRQCEANLPSATVPKQWPRLWSDAPESFRKWADVTVLNFAKEWVKPNQQAIANGAWPQYYVGAFPYCYRLPDYTSSTWPPAPQADMMSAHADGSGSDEMDEASAPVRPLIMGQAPGTHWYHAHKHGSTTINVSNGMTGVYIIEGKYDAEIKAGYPGGIKQQVMVIQQLGGTSQLEGAAGPDPYFSVNGQLQPVITMKPGEVQWWRIANTSSRAGTYFLSPTGLKWKQLAQDGVQFNNANYQASNNNAFLLSSGNRADLLVQAPTAAGTYSVLVNNTVDPSDRGPGSTQLTLLTVNVPSGPNTGMNFLPNAPSFPPFLTDIKPNEVKATRTIVFSTSGRPPTPSMHRIDGKLFDGEVGAAVVLNQVEEWKIVNETFASGGGGAKISHPFHIHINPFQISEFFDPSSYISSTAGAAGSTVTVVAATAPATGGTVTGVGTSFTTSAHVGDFLLINGQRPATILSIASNTSLKISSAINVTTGASYSIAVPQYTINPNQVRPGQCLINPADAKPCTAIPPTNRIWWDVLAIPSGNVFYDATNPATSFKVPGYFKMQSRFVDYAGYYVIHCHILAHEDRGMMTVVYVTPLQPPFSHH